MVYDTPDVVYIDKVENETNVRMASRVGSRVPAYRTAVGKAILAWLGEEEVQAVVAAGMPPVTQHTTTDPQRLRAELDRVRRQATPSTTARTSRRRGASPRPSSTTPTRRSAPSASPASPPG